MICGFLVPSLTRRGTVKDKEYRSGKGSQWIFFVLSKEGGNSTGNAPSEVKSIAARGLRSFCYCQAAVGESGDDNTAGKRRFEELAALQQMVAEIPFLGDPQPAIPALNGTATPFALKNKTLPSLQQNFHGFLRV